VTCAQSAWAETSPLSVAVHGTEVDVDEVVDTAPVSGNGASVSSGAPSSVTFAARPYARAVSTCGVTTTDSSPQWPATGLLFAPE
jgi:hypothetical protein